ncbi:VOC family protein [Flavobacterium beibuense]|uniref:Glyoxalase/bleomycin resistance protein/dioxygenase n=1 Tax=Flavobacterium beibuense TaxID=657326 RepID=A0A444W7X5_9FLAO|nr:VOC family protein [Flavobacterium beibuense]RYJ41970.1 Glyoxalase/bleomycin resistance protein/dioxygenase [Flavobacterium beibuense]
MKAVNPYLNFNGNTEEAFNFYKSVFGGEFATIMRFGDTPGCENMPETEKNGIMHVALPMGSSILMGTDVPKSMEQVKFGTNSSITIDAESREEAKRLFDGLAAGGKIGMPMDDMFWGAYYGMLTDKFGVQWMINFDTRNS